jgi:parallel beta-helix repeat protein
MAGNGFMFTGAHWEVKNLKLNMDDAVGLRVTTNTLVQNVTVEKDINNSNSRAFFCSGSDCHLFDCSGYSIQSPVKGRGVEGAGWASILFCEFYNLEEGADLTQVGCTFMFNVVRDCITVGLDAGADAQVIMFNTIDGNVDGIDLAGTTNCIVINNQISNNSSEGIVADADNHHVDHNNWHGNSADVNGVSKGDNATANDPGYTDEPGNNFSGVDDTDAFAMLRGVT